MSTAKTYSYNEAFESSLKYFNGDELAAKAFLDKYSLRNNNDEILEDNPSKMHRRLASEFARIQKNKYKKPLSEDEIYSLLDGFKKIIPQGSPMFGIGNNYQTISISNCFVLDTPEDSYNSILDVDKQLVNISKRRGGVGIDLSKLRPKGSVTNNAARSSTGIVSWMERYSNSIREVGQHGRRGALMLTLSIHHPDILDFTTVKNDNSKVTGANISIRLSKEFLDAVRNNEDYELRFPVDYKETGAEPKISKLVKAKDIWDVIIKSAWMRAEPGLVMWDNVMKGPADCYEKYRSVTSNPCVTGDTKILTKNGSKRIDKLVGKKVEVWNGYEWSLVEPKITGFNKEIVLVKLSNGKKLKCTFNHYFILANEERIQCKDLKIGDILFGGKCSVRGGFLSNPSVVSLTFLPDLAEAVYCFTEKKRNLGTFNGILTGQCSEIFMPSLESCRLLAINLYGYVKKPFTKESFFDYDEFYKEVKISQRLMDNVVDLESEKIDQILKKIKQDPESDELKEDEVSLWNRIKKLNDECRRTGLGITALGDTLAAIGVKYGSEESIEVTEKIYKTLKLAAYESSVEMAEELGSFNDYDSTKEENCEFILRIKEERPDIYDRMVKSGRRNIALTTTAPTGTVSIMAQTSSGIEPVFNLGYKRRKKINPNDKNGRVDFVDQNGDSWQEFMVYHNKVKDWINITGNDKLEESPWWGATANDIDWINRVKLQAAAQKHVCHAISSCLASENSWILTDNGFKKIEDFSFSGIEKSFKKVDGEIKSVNINNELTQITETFNNGVANTIKLALENGYFIEATPNHKVTVLNQNNELEWKELSDINISDTVVGRKGLNLWNSVSGNYLSKLNGSEFVYDKKTSSNKDITVPSRLTLELARLIGYLCSDGHVGVNGIGLTQVENNIGGDFQSLVFSLFNYIPKKSEDGRSLGLNYHTVCSKEIKEFFKWLGITTHDTIRVPKIIMESPGSKYVKEFIIGATLDGHVSKNNICVATSISEKYLVDIQQLLLNLGIETTLVRANKAGERVFPGKTVGYKTKESYSLLITDSIFISKFINEIGFAEERKQNECRNKYKRSVRIKCGGQIPDFGLRKSFRSDILPNIKSLFLYRYFSGICRSSIEGQLLNRESLLEMKDIGFKVPELLLDNTYCFWRVKNKVFGNSVQTYDLSVPNGNSYIANGIISHNTINLPEDVTEAKVAEIYETSFRSGVKGITIYRDNCRTGVLVDTKKEEAKVSITQTKAPKRPKSLKCDVHNLVYQGKKYYSIVGLLNGSPYEVFLGHNDGDETTVPKSVKEGELVKKGKGKYVLSCPDKEFSCILSNTHTDENADVLSRLVSTSLRHGTPLVFIIDQLEKSKGELTSLSKVFSRVLKKYIKDGTEVSGERCPECSGKLVRENGCKICKGSEEKEGCGWTACS